MPLSAGQEAKLQKIVSLANELLSASSEGNTSSKISQRPRIRRSGRELVAFRKMLKSERKKGVPVAELAKKHGVSAAYIYQLWTAEILTVLGRAGFSSSPFCLAKYFYSNALKKETPMSILPIEERIQLLKNLLDDPFDWVSKEILRLADEHERLNQHNDSREKSDADCPLPLLSKANTSAISEHQPVNR
jgi:hypothetical protein